MKDYTLEKRKYVIGMAAVVIVLIYVIRLFDLQIMTDDYKKNADSNAFLNKIQYPSRGAIYDRNGKLLVLTSLHTTLRSCLVKWYNLIRWILSCVEHYARTVPKAYERCKEPLDESRLFQIYASGIYDTTLGRRVRCVSGEAIQISWFLYPAAYYPAIYL